MTLRSLSVGLKFSPSRPLLQGFSSAPVFSSPPFRPRSRSPYAPTRTRFSFEVSLCSDCLSARTILYPVSCCCRCFHRTWTIPYAGLSFVWIIIHVDRNIPLLRCCVEFSIYVPSRSYFESFVCKDSLQTFSFSLASRPRHTRTIPPP